MDVLGDSKQDNAPIGQFHQGRGGQKLTLGFNACVNYHASISQK
jgi:hypothetical protein